MGGSPKKSKVKPSFEEGKLRDVAVEKMQESGFTPKELLNLIKKAVRKAPSGA